MLRTTAPLLLILTLALPAVASPPAEPPTPAPSSVDPGAFPADLTPGPLEVVHVEELRFDRDGRTIPLPLKVRHPVATDAQPGPFPLVVFSHGMGGYTDAFENLSTHLASHGYVVIHPAHTDSVRLRHESGESTQSIRQTFTRGGTSSVDLRSRVDDCLWITNNLDAIETELAAAGLIDRSRTALAGHSAGAMTTQALAGLSFQMPRTRQMRELSDGSAFDAYIVISGQGTTRPSLNERSWQGINRPMLVLSGTEDVSRVSDETPQSRRHPFEFAPDGDKYLIHIDGATHASYQGGDAPNADEQRIEALTTHATLAFLEAYLRDHAAANAWLNLPAGDKFTGVTAEYLAK